MEIIDTNRQFKCEPVSHCGSNMDVDNALNYAMEVIPHHCGPSSAAQQQQQPAMPPMEYGERRERVLLRPWLENLINSGYIPGLEWIDEARTMFKVPWKHRSKKNWSLRHSSVFLEWAKNTGRWKEGDPEPNYAQLKTRLRCAFNKAPDIDEMKELHCTKSEEPYKVYRFTERRDGKSRPLVRMFVTKTSCGPHVVRRRRRPKQLLPSRPLLNMVGRDLQHSVPGLKMEPPGEVDSWTQEMECRWKAEMRQQSSCSDYIIPRSMDGGYPPELSHRGAHMSVKMDRYSDEDYKPVMVNGGACNSSRPSLTPCRILPPPEEEYGMPSPPDWTPPFPLTSHDATAGDDSRRGHDSRLLILQAASEIVEATDRQRQVYIEYEDTDVYDRMPPRASSAVEPMLHPVSSPGPVQTAREEQSPPKPSPVISSESEKTSSPSCDDGQIDDSAPPLVRFKKRYLRAQQLAERHQLSIDTASASDAAGTVHNGDLSSSNVSPTSPSELFNERSPVKLSPAPIVDGRDVMAVMQRECQRAMPRDWSPVRYGTVVPEKRTWSRIAHVDLPYRDQPVEMMEQRCDAGQSHEVNSLERYAVYEPQSKRRHIVDRRSIDGSSDYANYSHQNFLPNGHPSLAGCNETVLYREMIPCSPQSTDSVAVNLSYNKVESPSSQQTTEAIDLTKKNPLSHADYVRQPQISSAQYGHPMERKLPEQWNEQIIPKPEMTPGTNDTKDFVCAEADIQRKSNLIISKTAVLFDKEQKLRDLEKELVAREEELYWQEHQLHPPDLPVRMRSTPADRCQLPVEDRYYGDAEYRDVRRLAPATVERLQAGPRILPSHDGSQGGVLNNSGWPVEKLEEQFARLVKTSQDVLPAHKSILCSPPEVHTYEDEYALQMQKQQNEMRMPHESYANGGGGWHDSMPGYHNLVARKRGRPKGSKTRMRLKDIYSSASYPSPVNQSREQHYARNYYGNLPASPEGRMDGMPAPLPPPPLKTEFPRQNYLKSEPIEPRNAAVDGFVSPSSRRIFSGGQVVAANRSRMVSNMNGMPPKVRQMLETTAGTTGASILPPLSPAPAGNEQDAMCRRGPAYRTNDEFRQHSATPNHYQQGHYVAVAPANVSRTPVRYENELSPMAQSPYQAVNGSVASRPGFVNRRPSNDAEGLAMNPKWRNDDNGNASHILPNICSFDRDRDVADARVGEQWNVAKRNRVEEWRRSVVSSCASSTVDGDDSDGRLVIALDGE